MKLNVARMKAEGGSDWRERAMEAIWDAWYRPLAAYLRTSFNLSGDTEDLMQEIMFKVFRALDDFDGRHALSTWLYAIARNTCLDWLASVRLPTRSASSLATEPAARGDSTESRVLAASVDAEVTRILAGLDPQDRGIAWLAFYEQAPYRRIAEAFGVPLHTVKNRVFALRRLLKTALEDYHA